MSKRLYVGNLPYNITREELAAAFEEWGPIESADIIVDHATGQSKGFGFVQLPDDKATTAVNRMNGSLFKGRPLKVNEARPRDSQPRDDRGRPDRSRDDRGRPGGGYAGDSPRGWESRPSGPRPASPRPSPGRSSDSTDDEGRERALDVTEEFPDVRRNRPLDTPPGEGGRDSGGRDGGRGRDQGWREPPRKSKDGGRPRERERDRDRREWDWE